jgi:hypothetical protein
MVNRIGGILFPLLLLIIGCKQHTIKLSELSNYFETNDIDAFRNNNLFEIKIANSRLVKKKQQRMGGKWVNAEALASVGAVITYGLIDSSAKSKIDTVILNVQVDNHYERYSYTIKELRKTREYIEICENFAKVITYDDFSKVEPFLAGQILDAAPKVEIEAFLSKVFLKDKISKTEFIGVKSEEGVSSVYFNFYYEDSGAQSYVFNFLVGEDKIGGITVP